MSSRLSFGGSALRDSSSRMNASRSRRQSMGGGAGGTETPQKDRRAMLDDWRRQTKQEEPAANKRVRDDPTAAISTEGTTALERYRMRKQQKLLEQNNDENHGARPPLLPPTRSVISSHTCDDEETGDYSRAAISIGVSSGTPSLSRRLTTSGRAARRKSFSVGGNHRHMRESLSQESREPECKFSCNLEQILSIHIFSPTRTIHSFPAAESVVNCLCTYTTH